MASWQESQTILGTVENTSAGQPSRSDSNLGLSHLVTLAQRISIGIEEGQNAFLLVRLKNQPRYRKYENENQNQRNQHRRPDSTDEKPNRQRRQIRQRRSQIGLASHKSDRHETNQASFCDLRERHVPAGSQFGKVSRQRDN